MRQCKSAKLPILLHLLVEPDQSRTVHPLPMI